MSSPALSEGFISSHLQKGLLPPRSHSTFKVLGIKHISDRKYRLAVTDNKSKYNHALIVLPDDKDPSYLPSKDDVVDFSNKSDDEDQEARNLIHDTQGKTIWLIHHYTILPCTPCKALPSTPSSSSNGNASSTPPKPPVKRPSNGPPLTATPSPSTSNGARSSPASAVPAAKRALFSPSNASSPASPVNKATHAIKDLNPYQNKYTIRARCTAKGELKEISSSRWQGSVWECTLQDETGDIKLIGFDEKAKKFSVLFEEGKVYYVSHAQIRAIKNQRFNTTSHQYELNLNDMTVVFECTNASGVPSVLYNFTNISDLDNVTENDKVDVIGVCKECQDVKEITTRAGKQVKKRDIVLVDDSKGGSDVRVTLWSDKAERFSGVEEVVALKRANVSEWNGNKTLSVSFGGSYEVNPELANTQHLSTWYFDTYKPTHGHLSSQSSSQRANYDKEGFFTLGDIKLLYTGNQVGRVDQNFFNVEAYLTMLNGDNFAYRACPNDGCNKKVEERDPDSFYCNKCRLSVGNNYKYRYMLRGQLADCTGNQWFTAFDEAATQIVGMGAGELRARMEEDSAHFSRTLKQAQFVKYKMRVSAKTERYNDENRLKVTIYSAERIDQGSKEYLDRLKQEIEKMTI